MFLLDAAHTYSFNMQSLSRKQLFFLSSSLQLVEANRGLEYFWRKAGKALKKSQKTGNAAEICGKPETNLPGNRKMPCFSHGKIKIGTRSWNMENHFFKKLWKTGKG